MIQFPFNAKNVLVDTGKESAYYDLKKTLHQHGVKTIDTLVITHYDEDHYGNMTSLIEDFKIGEIVDSKDQTLEFAEILLAQTHFDDDNSNSLILAFEINAIRFLLMGDAYAEQEAMIVEEHPHLQADVLKLGHHGSKTSSSRDFLEAVRPKVAIISSLPSVYGHPHISVMHALYQLKIIPIETSREGNIRFFFTPFFTYVVTDQWGFGIMK